MAFEPKPSLLASFLDSLRTNVAKNTAASKRRRQAQTPSVVPLGEAVLRSYYINSGGKVKGSLGRLEITADNLYFSPWDLRWLVEATGAVLSVIGLPGEVLALTSKVMQGPWVVPRNVIVDITAQEIPSGIFRWPGVHIRLRQGEIVTFIFVDEDNMHRRSTATTQRNDFVNFMGFVA